MSNRLVNELINNLQPKSLVVDLGAGDGRWSRVLQAAGHKVIAVDKQTKPTDVIVDWQVSSAQNWVTDLKNNFRADGWLIKNLLQFIEKDYVLQELLPKIANHTPAEGVVAIETFYQPPNPPFAKPHKYYYSLSDLEAIFGGWKLILAEEVVELGPDLSGHPREFCLTRLVVKKAIQKV